MSYQQRKGFKVTARSAFTALVLVAACSLCLPSLASANYEQAPEHFGVSGESAQLYESFRMAVNSDGIGGVEAGSIYVVGSNGRVLRFSPGAEGEAPEFREAWGWGIAEGGPTNEFVKCGPAYAEIPEGSRPPHAFASCKPTGSRDAGEQVGHFFALTGVAVNEATGDVYVLNQPGVGIREHHLIEVFSATGTPIGEGFGDAGRGAPFPSEGIAEGPEKLHEQSPNEADGIAVDEAGTVFVTDRDFDEAPGFHQARIMSFEPVLAGDYEHYVYAGQGKDITTPYESASSRVALVGQDRLVASSKQQISEYLIGGGSSAVCSFEAQGGEITAMTTNPQTGEVFYYLHGAHGKLGRLGPCDPITGKFEELGQEPLSPKPEARFMYALAFNPDLAWGSLRPKGVLYGTDPELGTAEGLGYVFVPAEAQAPKITSESVASTGSSSSTLQAQIDPRGATTSFRFQYLTQAQYEANEPDEHQSLAVSATGGVFGLGFEGQRFGGEATANLTLGSETANALVTAKGTATVHAAVGTATLKGAVGTGTVIAGSAKITAVSATEGAFSTGQGITGRGIPQGTTIKAISGSELTLSAPATESEANTPLQAGATSLTALTTSEGTFEVGMSIQGQGISQGTTITVVKAGGGLTLSKPVTKPGTGVAITAGSMILDGLSVSEGTFVAGQPIVGEGIPAKTEIAAVESGLLRLSNPLNLFPSKPGVAVAVSSSGPAPLVVGEAVEGSGVPAGTSIAAIEAGELTLSQPATSSVTEAHLRTGLPFDASAVSVRKAFEGLASVGNGNVEVSGGPGDGSGSHPYDVTFTGSLTNQNLPQLSAESAGLTGGPATATVATLHDGGNGFAHGAVETPVPAGTVGASGVVTAAVSGLAPETAYRFRVIATSGCKGPGESLCETIGQATSFRTYPTTGAGLPDGRAYELVSPAQKQGGEVFPADWNIRSCLGECKPPGAQTFSFFPMQSVTDGDAVSYMGFPFSSSEGASVTNSYISRRTATGWQTTIMSPRLQENRVELSYAESLAQGVITTKGAAPPPLAAGGPAGYNNLYLQNAQDPTHPRPLLTTALFQALSASARPYREASLSFLQYAGHSSDFSAQYFEANDSLTSSGAYAPQPPDPGQTGKDLYEWREGQLALVNVLPGNITVATGASFASASPDTNAIADEGHRVYWTAGGHLYMREDDRITREVHDPGSFLTATSDGLEVLLSDGCLYSMTTASCSADLTQGHGGFLGIVGQSRDLSRIYFVDTAALGAEAKAGSCKMAVSIPQEIKEEKEGKVPPGLGCNLYLYESGAGTRFITTLVSLDGAGGNENLNDWSVAPGERTAEASPDGRYLAFGSGVSLTGYDNVGPCTHNLTDTEFVTAPCKEVFLYDSVSGRLTCPSCNSTGEAPLGNSTLRRIYDAGEWFPQPHYLTDQGRLVFDSSDRLSPRDTNGRVEDVYEAEPEGVGSCVHAAGCVLLVSGGTGAVDSNFLAMDERGEDVFFTSRDRLVQADTDELLDVYDARVDGGFPNEASATTLAGCRGEACQTTTTTTNPPAAPVSGTSSFQGTGNAKPENKPEGKPVKVQQKAQRCPKGKVRQKGKCVKRKAAKAKKPKKKAKKSTLRTSNQKHGGAK